jgi:ribosomal protein S18 acetylase RimI-like enzyme
MSDVAIRLAEPDEHDKIGVLIEAAYDHDYEIGDSYRASLRDVETRASEHQVWVAVDRDTGQLLGTVATPRPGGHISQLGQDGELDFRTLAVDPAARRRGIGRILVEHVIALAAERGLTRVVLNSGPQMIGAHRLYYAMGFTRLRDRETLIVEGHTEPLLTFGLELGDGTPVSAPLSVSLSVSRVPRVPRVARVPRGGRCRSRLRLTCPEPCHRPPGLSPTPSA